MPLGIKYVRMIQRNCFTIEKNSFQGNLFLMNLSKDSRQKEIAAWLWRMSHPYPREPLWKG